MATIQFGKTWWGQQWLKSLGHIDNSNRLPRGASYARKGSVLSVDISDNEIRAKVSGSRPKPYTINIGIPPFSNTEIKKLIDAISLQPVIISKLLNLELDPELLTIADKCGLKIFPKQWNDFTMKCSCPDYAVPCKHLAAVIYKLSAEIDNSPFLVFQLHKVDLIKELERVNIHINKETIEVTPLKDFLLTQNASKNLVKGDDVVNIKPNFATLSPILDSLSQLLPDAPAFYPYSTNFRVKQTTVLSKVAKEMVRIIHGKQNLLGSDKNPFTFNHHHNCNLYLDANNVAKLLVNQEQLVNLTQFISALWQIPVAYETDYQPNVAAFKKILLLSINLLANGAVVPKIVRLQNSSYCVMWLPALLSKEVRRLVDVVEQTLPADMVLFAETSAKTNAVSNQTITISSIFMGELIYGFGYDNRGDTYTDLFFGGKPAAFSAPGEQAIAGGIQAWLQRFHISNQNYKPNIVVEELNGDKFKIGIEIQETAKPLEKPVSMQSVFTHKAFDMNRFEILQSLSQLGSFIPRLDGFINQQGKSNLVLNMDEFTPFLMQAIPAIELLDISIQLPKSLQNILRPKATVKVKTKSASSGLLRLDKLLDFDWQVAIGDTLLNEAEFKQLMKSADGLIRYKTEFIYVNPADLAKLYKHFEGSKNLSAYEILRVALANDYYGAPIVLTNEVKQLINDLTAQTNIPLPQNINATLRPYQLRGYSWMYRNAQIGFGSVLADDMGLGKTLQVITTLLKFKEDGLLKDEKALVIAPTGLLTNWQSEIEKFSPSLKSKIHHGSNRAFEKDDDFDVMITTYGVTRSDANIFKKKKWHVVVIDEAQNIKNHTTESSKAVKSIKANTFIAMSGTPVENRLSELWSIMDFSNRGFMGTLKEFTETYSDPIENQNDIVVADRLKKVTSPFMMRRLKIDKSIISDLPNKIEMDAYCTLAPQQASLYEQTLKEALKTIEGLGTTKQELFERQGLVLQMIMALKQICNHPTQFLKNNVIDASLSGKTQLLFDKLETIIESNEKVLIFTQFTQMGELLKQLITERFGEEPLYYHGGCSVNHRNEMVQSFQTNRADKVFILSLKAAGTGLNLTAANHVIHYDLWWNPAVEAQATDRAYRIGQTSNVMVHRFITKNSFEEKINALIQSKKDLADLTVATGENWIGNLSNKEIKEIFTLG